MSQLTLTPLERSVRDHWIAGASRVHYGRCDECGQVVDEYGKPLLVARQERCRRFHCLPCSQLKRKRGART